MDETGSGFQKVDLPRSGYWECGQKPEKNRKMESQFSEVHLVRQMVRQSLCCWKTSPENFKTQNMKASTWGLKTRHNVFQVATWTATVGICLSEKNKVEVISLTVLSLPKVKGGIFQMKIVLKSGLCVCGVMNFATELQQQDYRIVSCISAGGIIRDPKVKKRNHWDNLPFRMFVTPPVGIVQEFFGAFKNFSLKKTFQKQSQTAHSGAKPSATHVHPNTNNRRGGWTGLSTLSGMFIRICFLALVLLCLSATQYSGESFPCDETDTIRTKHQKTFSISVPQCNKTRQIRIPA